jgi:hypothetical protein
VITDVGGVELLAQCCEAADLVRELAECVAREGVTLETKTGLRGASGAAGHALCLCGHHAAALGRDRRARRKDGAAVGSAMEGK